MQYNNFEMSILVDNKPIDEYYHNNSTFVEGRANSEYKIRVRNNTHTKGCFIVSVDGLSVLNGKECSNDSPGYILDPYQTLDIACYKVDEATGAKFVFGSKDKSYSAEIGKGTDNVGVIAMRVFREKPKPRGIEISSMRRSFRVSGGYGGFKAASGGMTASASTGGSWGLAQNSMEIKSLRDHTQGIVPSAEDAADMEDTKLGTQFGESMDWATRTVSFDRESTPVCSLVIYYDTRKNLERRGIRFDHHAPPLPNPFPGDSGCPTPPNWHK